MLDQREDPAGHEPGRAHGRATAGQFAHLDHAAPGPHIHPTAGACGRDLVGLGLTTGVDDDLDTVTSHSLNNA